jgi:hypothetical protein
MYPVKNPARETRPGILQSTTWAAIKLIIICLVTAIVPFALYVRVDSKAAKTTVTVQAAERGKQYFNFRDGRAMRLDYRGEQNLQGALQEGQAQPRSLASIVLADNAVPDLIAGYAYGGMGIVTVQHGNPDAFAPKDESVYARMQQGYNPDSLLPLADTYPVPESPDFLQVGDFNHDNRKDVLIAAHGGNLFLLAGDGQGRLNAATQISLPGKVTALTAGEFRALDGWTDVAVGVEGLSGAALLIYDGVNGLSGDPMTFQLGAPATGVQIAGLDNDSFMDVAVAAGSEVDIVHGWGRQHNVDPQSRLERISVNNNARELAVGFFIWNRAGSNQIAVLSDNGAVNILDQAGSDARPFTPEETAQFRTARLKVNREVVNVETLPGWQHTATATWASAREFNTNSSLGANAFSQNVMQRSHVSFNETDDLLLLNGSQNKLDLVRQVDSKAAAQSQSLSSTGDLSTISLDVTEVPMAVLAFPQKLNGERSLVVMQNGSASPTLVPLAPTALPTVDRFDDPVGGALAGASVCGAGPNDCSLRGAVQVANANPGSTITIPAGTVTLTSNGAGGGGCDGNTIGDLGINTNTTINGAGSGSTIILQNGSSPATNQDRVMCLNEPFSLNVIYSFSGMTISGGRDNTSFGAAAIVAGEKGNALTLTNVVISNNQSSGANVGGGAIQILGGDLTLNGCTIGGSAAPGAFGARSNSAADLSKGNTNSTSSGAGIGFDPSAPTHDASTGVFTVTNTTFGRNVAGNNGGGVTLFTASFNGHTAGTGSSSFATSTFSNNSATNGGGIENESFNATVATTSFNSNSASGRGGGIHVGGGTGFLLDGTNPTITFSGNTATLGGSSVSTNGLLNVSGTNTTIGGSVEVQTNGTWTNNTGSALNPTDVNVLGGTFTCNNSTMNLSGNLTIAPETTKGAIFNANTGTVNIQGNLSVNLNNGGSGAVGQFNAGTGTFDFNGSAAQNITNVSAFTFNNLTDSNVTQPLTLNNSFAVGGVLNINGANAIFAPVAAAIISGGGSLTGTGTARVTRTGADAFFSQYALTGGRTLTNLTVEYIGAGAQTASVTTYGPLKINNASNVTLGVGTTTVNGTLTLTAGQLGVGANTLVINNGTSVVAGSLTSGATGTVNYNQSSAGQSVLAANYGNLTFSAFTKVLPSTGIIGVAGTFTSPVTSGHTITGSTFDFNGTGAQTIPVFDYNNLTISGARTVNNVTLANGTINVAGNFTANETFTSGVFVVTGNTVNFNGGGPQSLNGTATSQAFNNFTVNKSGGTLTAGGSLTTLNIAGAVTLTAGGFDAGALTSIVMSGGDWTNNGGTFTPSISVVSFTNTAAGQNINGTAATQTFNGITVAKTAQTLSVGGSTTTLNLNGPLTLTSGTFDKGTAAAINVAGNWTNNGGTFTPGTGTVTFNGAVAQSLNGSAATQTFNNFAVNKSLGTLTGGGSTTTLTLNGGMTLTAGTFAAGTITNIGLPGDWTNNGGTFTPGTSTVTFNSATAGQNINGSAASQTFNNITVNKTGQTLTVGGSTTALTLNGTMLLTAGTFDKGTAANINVGGNWTNNGGTFTAGAGTVTFNSTTAAQTINGTALAQTFNNITVNKAGQTLSVGGSTTSLTIAGNLLLSAGVFDKGTAATIDIQGNWTNNTSAAAFTAGTGLVNFNGAATQTIGGTASTTFNNLTNSNVVGISMANDNTVNGILALGTTDITVAATKTLAQPVGGSSTGTSDVNGRIQRLGIDTAVLGTAFSFGNPNNRITITAGTRPANIVVDLARSVPTGGQGYPTAVQRTYTITPSIASGFTGTLRLHYLPGELNGNNPATLNLWRFDSTINAWRPQPATSRDCASGCDTNTSSFWVEKVGVTTFSPWTLNSTNAPTASNGVVTGRILDSNGAPVEGAVVRLDGPQSRKFITDANGFYRFENVDTNGFYTVTPSRANYSFNPSARSFSQIGESTEAAFGATLAPSGYVNPLDTPEYFVRQNYLDFLGREPDEAGFNFWSDQILSCATDQACIAHKRENVSAAYFLSIEFQKTGGLVDGLYRASYGARPGFGQFMPDVRTVGQGVIVNQEGWQDLLDANKETFLKAFVNRPAFHAAYDSMENALFVDTLIHNTGVQFTSGERDALVGGLTTGTMSRAEALRSIAENNRFADAKFNEAFVMMEYFGYLRRDADSSGFAFWLSKLNEFGGNFERAEMVKAFMVSGEYRDRFPR